MATLSYTFVSRCAGGGHTTFDVSLNGGTARRVVYTTDELRAALSALTEEEIRVFTLVWLKVHEQGKTRAQIVTEFNNAPGGVVTGTI